MRSVYFVRTMHTAASRVMQTACPMSSGFWSLFVSDTRSSEHSGLPRQVRWCVCEDTGIMACTSTVVIVEGDQWRVGATAIGVDAPNRPEACPDRNCGRSLPGSPPVSPGTHTPPDPRRARRRGRRPLRRPGAGPRHRGVNCPGPRPPTIRGGRFLRRDPHSREQLFAHPWSAGNPLRRHNDGVRHEVPGGTVAW